MPTSGHLEDYVNGLTQEASPDTVNDMLLMRRASDGEMVKVSPSDLGLNGGGGGQDGWTATGETWTYASADDPTFTLTVSGDKTSKYSAGMRVKLTQTSVKYFLITAVSYDGVSDTTVTLYGGTDYDLANAAITLPYYSTSKAPLGFPLDPAKWTAEATSTSNVSQSTPAANTWYNIGPLSLTIPIGCWRILYEVAFSTSDAASSGYIGQTTLSTANNSESDVDFTAAMYNNASVHLITTMHREKFVTLASKTTYYLNSRTQTVNLDTLQNRGDLSKTIIRAVCAYL